MRTLYGIHVYASSRLHRKKLAFVWMLTELSSFQVATASLGLGAIFNQASPVLATIVADCTMDGTDCTRCVA